MDAVVRKQVEGKRPGTTLTAALVRGRKALVVHVGDSRAYLVRSGGIRQLTQDHTAGQAVRDSGATPAPMFDHVLLNAIGGDPKEPAPEACTVDLEIRDVLLLVTDGVTRHVTDREMCEIASSEGPAAVTDRLLALALERGGEDNATAIVARACGE
jgi:serine/threonine protein phosphatase PrpC